MVNIYTRSPRDLLKDINLMMQFSQKLGTRFGMAGTKFQGQTLQLFGRNLSNFQRFRQGTNLIYERKYIIFVTYFETFVKKVSNRTIY